MVAAVDEQGYLRCRGHLPDGAPCLRVLWRLSRDGTTLVLHDPLTSAGAVEIPARQPVDLRHTCPACRTVWRPTELAA